MSVEPFKFTYRSVHWLAALETLWCTLGDPWSCETKNNHESVIRMMAQCLSEGRCLIVKRTSTGYEVEAR